jgi:hypothetical protein
MVVRLKGWSKLALDHIETGAALLRASLALEAACAGLDRNSDAFLNDLVCWLETRVDGEIELGPDDPEDGKGLTDWFFLTDRAETHRQVAETLIADGLAIAKLAIEGWQGVEEIPDNWRQRDDLRQDLRAYTDAVTAASDNAKNALMESNSLNFEPGIEKLGPVVRFLSQEASQFTTFLEE